MCFSGFPVIHVSSFLDSVLYDLVSPYFYRLYVQRMLVVLQKKISKNNNYLHKTLIILYFIDLIKDISADGSKIVNYPHKTSIKFGSVMCNQICSNLTFFSADVLAMFVMSTSAANREQLITLKVTKARNDLEMNLGLSQRILRRWKTWGQRTFLF